ncbi:MAG: hypothetical protein AMXMBFR36_38590 [Acidobacteriota bacterium]
MQPDALASSRLDGSAAAHSPHRPDEGDPWSPRFRRLLEACEALGAAEDLAVLERAIESFGVDRLGRVQLELPVAPSPRARLLLRELCDVVLARNGELVVRWADDETSSPRGRLAAARGPRGLRGAATSVAPGNGPFLFCTGPAQHASGGTPPAREYNLLCSSDEGKADGRPSASCVPRAKPRRAEAVSRPVTSGPPKDCQLVL